MLVEDHAIFSEWARAWDEVHACRQHYKAAEALNIDRLIKAMKEKHDGAIATYETIVGKLSA